MIIIRISFVIFKFTDLLLTWLFVLFWFALLFATFPDFLYHHYQFLNLFFIFCFVLLFCFSYLILIKRLLLSHEMVKVSRLLCLLVCLVVCLFVCLICSSGWNCRKIIQNLIAFSSFQKIYIFLYLFLF